MEVFQLNYDYLHIFQLATHIPDGAPRNDGFASQVRFELFPWQCPQSSGQYLQGNAERPPAAAFAAPLPAQMLNRFKTISPGQV